MPKSSPPQYIRDPTFVFNLDKLTFSFKYPQRRLTLVEKVESLEKKIHSFTEKVYNLINQIKNDEEKEEELVFSQPLFSQVSSIVPTIDTLEKPFVFEQSDTSSFSVPFIVEIVTPTMESLKHFYDQWYFKDKFSFCLYYSVPINNKTYIEEDSWTFLTTLCKIEGIAVCWSPKKVFYLSLSQDTPFYNERWEIVKNVLTNPDPKKILYNIKPHLKLLFANGIVVRGQLLDPKIAAWLREPDLNKDKTIHQLALEFGNFKSKNMPSFHSFEYCLERAFKSFLIMENILSLESQSPNFLSLFGFEMLITPILAHMEYNGIGFVNEICQQDRLNIEETIQYLENLAYSYAKGKFNLTSPKEVAQILFIELQLPTIEKGKNTSQAVLHKLCEFHPLPEIILQHRKLTHLLTHYLDILSKYSFHDKQSSINKICTTIQQTVVPTGRISCNDPNLQSISNKVEFIPYGRKQLLSVSIRNSFVPSPGYVFVSADYAQLELRLMAHFSKDEILLQHLTSETDAFIHIASHWLKKPVEQINFDERQITKHICYGILYGMGSKALSEKAEITVQEARIRISQFKSSYPKLNDFIQRAIQDAKVKGYVSTLFGRRRYLPSLRSTNAKEKARAERQAVNTICQGSAADLVKLAMIKVYQCISKNHFQASLLLQIHDELLFEVKEEQLVPFVTSMREVMEITHLSIPIPVKISFGNSWVMVHCYMLFHLYDLCCPRDASVSVIFTSNNFEDVNVNTEQEAFKQLLESDRCLYDFIECSYSEYEIEEEYMDFHELESIPKDVDIVDWKCDYLRNTFNLDEFKQKLEEERMDNNRRSKCVWQRVDVVQ